MYLLVGVNGKWEIVSDVLEEIKKSDTVEPNVVHYTMAIQTCDQQEKYAICLELWEDMLSRNIKPDATLYGNIMHVLQKTGQNDEALRMLQDMRDNGLDPTEYCFDAALFACHQKNAPKRALEIFEMARKENKVSAMAHIALLFTIKDDVGLALEVYSEMKRLSEPWETKFSIVLKALIRICLAAKDLPTALQVNTHKLN